MEKNGRLKMEIPKDEFWRLRMETPKDEFSSGTRDDMCWAKVYGRTKEEAEAKKKKYFDTYPTRGYNTNVHSQGWLNGYYYIIIDRWHSCD